MASTLGFSSALALAEEAKVELNDLSTMPLEELMNIKITTASKKEQTLAEATSIVSVITRKEIEDYGVLTLFDLMKRVPGFFPTHQATWDLITSRGLPADSNDHFLLLVDGHPQNSIIGQAFQQQDIIPVLDKVERVEIIRGPGSVLWGSSAVMGIINVITRDYIKKPKLTAEAQTAGQLDYVNFMAGLGDGVDVKGIYSITLWGAKGYRYTSNGENAVAFPWGSKPTDTWFQDWPYINKQNLGVELYSRVQFKDNTEVVARLLKTSFNYVWDEWKSPTGNASHELGNRRAYLSLRKKANLSDSIQLEGVLYGDYNLQNRDPLAINDATNYGTLVQDQTSEEFALGSELIATAQLTSQNTLKAGVKYVRTNIGPNRDAKLDPTTNVPVATGSGTDNNGAAFTYSSPYFGVEPGIDNAASLYAEDSQRIGPATVFAACRADWNDFREHGTRLLPRAGLVYNFSDHIVGKYTFNTGYLRPSAVYSKTVGIIVDTSRGGAFPIGRVSSSESVRSHDLQFSYTSNNTYAAATFFYMSVSNFISFDANNNPQGYKSFGDTSTFGLELESKHKLMDSLLSYGNFSYAKGMINGSNGALADMSGNTLNYPQLIANLGLTWTFFTQHSINTNLRGWSNMRYIKSKDLVSTSDPSAFGELGPEFYLDLNYQFKDAFLKDLDFNVFAFNVTDNQDRVGMVVNNGTYRPLGRTLGLRASYSF